MEWAKFGGSSENQIKRIGGMSEARGSSTRGSPASNMHNGSRRPVSSRRLADFMHYSGDSPDKSRALVSAALRTPSAPWKLATNRVKCYVLLCGGFQS